jgi:GT2 family glycosyltransferase
VKILGNSNHVASRVVTEAHHLLSEGLAEASYDLLVQSHIKGLRSLGLFVGLGRAALALHDGRKAERWWLKALEKDPFNPECHLGLGTARYLLGRLNEAVQGYSCALEIDPDMQAAHISLALAYLKAQCPAQALTHAEKALSREPQNTDMRLTRAAALTKLGRANDAIPDLVWLHAQGAKLGDVGLLECEVNRALGDFEAALVLAAELAEAFPTLPAPLQSFRATFANFVASASATRINDFMDGLGLPRLIARASVPAELRSSRRKTLTTDVIIPVHDGLDSLRGCLESLERHRSAFLGKIILVNDCSSPLTRGWLNKIKRERSDIQVVHTRKRSGFTRSLAFGVSHSHAKRFVALNSDCIVSEGWLERLSSAMPPKGRVALVGPLSNNAAWQSLGNIFDSNGNFAGQPLPQVAEIGHIQKRLDLLKVFGAPGSALIHGFCVLVDREIYEGLGGLDLVMFPKGYGEFQDLSLRAIDAGYELRVADDCFVGHARGRSIANDTRAELSREARSMLYKRYSAIRYLSAECSAAINPQIAFTRRRLEIIDRYFPGEVKTCQGRAKVTIHGDVASDLSGERVCIFVAFAPDGRLLPYTLRYLSELKAQGFQIVLVVNEIGPHRLPAEALSLARIVMLRDNFGFDFGAWRDAVSRIPSVWNAKLLLFTNDSIVGPFHGIDSLLSRIEQNTAPLFFATESEFAVPHFQSFFWGVKGAGMSNDVVRSFLASVVDVTEKTAAIFLYEVFFRYVCEKLGGIASFCLFPLADLTGVDSDIRPTFNPTHHLWRELLRSGFPFLKSDFCRKNSKGADATAWLTEITACGGDPMLARLHIEAVHVQRTQLSA